MTPARVPVSTWSHGMAGYAAYALLKSAMTWAETGAMIDPEIEQVFSTTEAGAPDEPTSPPVIVPFVQVTAPRPPAAALRTAKLAAEPSEGGVAASAGVGTAPSIPAAIRIARETVPKTRGPTRRSSLPAALSNSKICLQLAHRTRAPIPSGRPGHADPADPRLDRRHAFGQWL